MSEKEMQLEKEWRASLSEALKEIKSDLKEIRLQTTKTNGRVTSLEIKHSLCPIAQLVSDHDKLEEELGRKLQPIEVIQLKQLENDNKIQELQKITSVFAFFINHPKIAKFIIYAILTLLGYNTLFNFINQFGI